MLFAFAGIRLPLRRGSGSVGKDHGFFRNPRRLPPTLRPDPRLWRRPQAFALAGLHEGRSPGPVTARHVSCIPSMNKRLLLTLFSGVLLAALDIAVLGPAQPGLRAEFSITPRAASWLITVYVLANLVGTPLLSHLSDRKGRRSIYLFSVSLFALGSLGMVLGQSFSALLVARALQGFGSGGLFPVASAVIGET